MTTDDKLVLVGKVLKVIVGDFSISNTSCF